MYGVIAMETPATVESDEEFSDEFQCCVCLDLLYKPVVLACGHISCFWCVFRAMKWEVSHCPVCRHPYHHFPRICQLLHFVVLKLYPKAYKRKEQQVIEQEKRLKEFSPQLDNCFRSELSEGLSMRSDLPSHSAICSCNSMVSEGLCDIVEGEPSTIKGPGSTIVFHKQAKMSIPAEANFEGTGKMASVQYSTLGLGGIWNKQKNSQQFLITDFHCAVCKELLYRPVVLNCGHVFCEVCINNPTDRVPICQVCQSAHPNGCPKVCLLLKQFLEEQFSEQYALRKENVCKYANSQSGSLSSCSIQPSNNAAKLTSISTNRYQSGLSGWGPKVHIGVGCDYCGMFPIIGERYKCKDCKEEIGFDLCEGCYNSSSKLPGRFNQQHTPEHKFENVQLHLEDLVSRLEINENESDDTSENEEDAHSI